MKLLHLTRDSNALRQVFDWDTTESDADAAPHTKPHAEIARLHARIATLEPEVTDGEAELAARD